MSEMVSARIRYEDYFQEVGSQKGFIKKRIRVRRKSGRANRKKEVSELELELCKNSALTRLSLRNIIWTIRIIL